MTFYIIAAVVCIALSAFFSGAEMALSSANRIRLENLADDGKRSAALAVKILDRFDDALSAISEAEKKADRTMQATAAMM